MTTTETNSTTPACPICGTALRHTAEALRCIQCELDYEREHTG